MKRTHGNVFIAFSEVKSRVSEELGTMEDDVLNGQLSRIYHHRLSKNKKHKLNTDEMRLLDCLLRNGYNPNTVYRWSLLVSKVPQEIELQLKHNKISQREASKQKNRTKKLLNIDGEELIKLIRKEVEVFYK